jgi:hypothetical protein
MVLKSGISAGMVVSSAKAASTSFELKNRDDATPIIPVPFTIDAQQVMG